MKNFTLLLLFLGVSILSFGQDHVIKVELMTDDYASETSWRIYDYEGSVVGSNGTLADNSLSVKEVTVPAGCYYFTLFDSYGDGIYTSSTVYGYCKVYFDDVLVGELDDPRFGFEFSLVQIGNDCPANAASFESLDLKSYQMVNTDFDVIGTIKNYGSDNITALKVGFSIDGVSQASSTITGMDVAPGETYQFAHDEKANLSSIDTYSFRVTIGDVNNADNEIGLNKEQEMDITTVSRIPVKRVFGEEATGTWCGWCPRGAVYMDSMALKYPNTWIGVAVHNADPMVVEEYDDGIGDYIGGYPSGLVDRAAELDPSQFEAFYLQQIEVISPVDVEVVDLTYDEATRAINFDVKGTFVTDLEKNLRFNAVIIENHVTGSESGYNQANYYSGGNYGPMGGYEDLPPSVSYLNMEYQFVARAILGGWDGTSNSIPAMVSADEEVSHSYSYTLHEDYDAENIKVIGLVIDQDSKEVLNAVKVSLIPSSIEDIANENQVTVYPNPAIDNVVVKLELSQIQDVTIKVIDIMGKEVKRKDIGSVQSGSFETVLNVTDLTEGIYLLQVESTSETITRKINIVK